MVGIRDQTLQLFLLGVLRNPPVQDTVTPLTACQITQGIQQLLGARASITKKKLESIRVRNEVGR